MVGEFLGSSIIPFVSIQYPRCVQYVPCYLCSCCLWQVNSNVCVCHTFLGIKLSVNPSVSLPPLATILDCHRDRNEQSVRGVLRQRIWDAQLDSRIH